MSLTERKDRPTTYTVEGAANSLKHTWNFCIYPSRPNGETDFSRPGQDPTIDNIKELLAAALTLGEAKERAKQQPTWKGLLEIAQDLDSHEGRRAAKHWFQAQERSFLDDLTVQENIRHTFDRNSILTNLWHKISFCRKAQQFIP